jgi:MFS family permease
VPGMVCFQLGALGLLLSGGTFLILTDTMSSQDFLDYGWRIPFIASSLLVVVGFYIRLKITETPLSKIQERTGRSEIRFSLLKFYKNQLILAHLQPLPLLVFYLMTVFTLSWATSDLGYSKRFSINAVVFGIVFAFSFLFLR